MIPPNHYRLPNRDPLKSGHSWVDGEGFCCLHFLRYSVVHAEVPYGDQLIHDLAWLAEKHGRCGTGGRREGPASDAQAVTILEHWTGPVKAGKQGLQLHDVYFAFCSPNDHFDKRYGRYLCFAQMLHDGKQGRIPALRASFKRIIGDWVARRRADKGLPKIKDRVGQYSQPLDAQRGHW